MARTAGRFNAVRTEFVPAAQAVQKTYHTALYARFSVDMNGSGKADGSIESQLQIMRDYAGQHPEFGVLQEYVGSRYYEQYVTGTVSREELLGKQKLIADKIAKLKAQIDMVQEKMDAREKLFKEKQRWLRSLLRLKEMDEPEIDRDIITALVKRIDVYPDKNMEITYTFDGAFQSSADKEEKK